MMFKQTKAKEAGYEKNGWFVGGVEHGTGIHS